MIVPTMTETFRILEVSYSSSEKFIAKLRKLAISNGRKLALTHEAPMTEWESIKNDGQIDSGGSIFCTVGHLDKKSFVTGPGVIIQIELPEQMIKQGIIVPDMVYDTPDDLLKKYPDVTGAEVSVGIDSIPSSMWKSVIDNTTGENIEF